MPTKKKTHKLLILEMKEKIDTDPMDIKRIRKEYYEYFHVHKFDTLMK